MIKPDLILVWPDTIEFPLFSKFLNEERDRFEKVIIVFSQTNWGPSAEMKVMSSITDALFLPAETTPPGEDWRNFAVNRALKHSFSPWIWFTEQDFTPKEGFWKHVAELEEKKVGVIGIQDNNRLHPCSLFIKRSVLDKTSKDFSARPNEGYDHFGKIYQDLDKINVTIGFVSPEFYHHYAGLTHNLHLLMQGQKPVYKPEEFYEYLDKVKAYEASQLSA